MLQYCMVGHVKNMDGKWKNKMAALQDPHLATFLILGWLKEQWTLKSIRIFLLSKKNSVVLLLLFLSFMQAGFDQYYA